MKLILYFLFSLNIIAQNQSPIKDLPPFLEKLNKSAGIIPYSTAMCPAYQNQLELFPKQEYQLKITGELLMARSTSSPLHPSCQKNLLSDKQWLALKKQHPFMDYL